MAFCKFCVTHAGCVVQRHIYLKLLIIQNVLTACFPKADTIAYCCSRVCKNSDWTSNGCRLDNEPGSREFPTSFEGRGTSLDAIQDTASKCQRINIPFTHTYMAITSSSPLGPPAKCIPTLMQLAELIPHCHAR